MDEQEHIEHAIKASVSVIMDAVIEVIGVDGHQWSDRPCQTCQAVSSLIGKPYGCYWYQQRKKRESMYILKPEENERTKL